MFDEKVNMQQSFIFVVTFYKGCCICTEKYDCVYCKNITGIGTL